MLRRFCALLLMLACAFAPVLPVQAATAAKAADCCCDAKCACDNGKSCVPTAPAPAPTRAPEVVTTALEQRVVAARPAARVAFAVFARLLTDFDRVSASSLRPVSAERLALADSVALFEAHCSRLI